MKTSRSQPGCVPAATTSDAEPSAVWEIHYAMNNLVHLAPFATEKAARAAFRRFTKARASFRRHSNDGSPLFRMRTALGEVAVDIEGVQNISLINVAASLAHHACVTALAKRVGTRPAEGEAKAAQVDS